MGTNDLVKDSRADLSASRRPALYWLSATVTAARAYGLDVLDGVYNDFRTPKASAANACTAARSASTARR